MKFNKDECLTINYQNHQIKLDSWSLSLSNQKKHAFFCVSVKYYDKLFSTHQIMWKGSQGEIEDPSKIIKTCYLSSFVKRQKKRI